MIDFIAPFTEFHNTLFQTDFLMPFEPNDSFSELNRRQRIFETENLDNEDNGDNSIIHLRRNAINIFGLEQAELKELKSNNENFIKEKDIKFNLYPLFINWKKIESKSIENDYFKIFKLFGYFGEAIYEILRESLPKVDNNDYYTYKNFINELNKLYKKEFKKEEIEKNNFYKKIMSINDDVISLVRNKIIIFKEIPIFLIIFKIYQSIYISLKDKKNIIESLKYQFIILSYMKTDEYDIIYNKYLKRFKIGRYLGLNIFQRNKEEYIKQIKKDYKKFE
jgi:hypothetical protein